MKSNKYVLVAFLMSGLTIAGYSQTNDSVVKDKKTKSESDDRSAGLKKLTDNRHRWDFDFDLDDEALEARIEKTVDQAMKNVSVVLKNLDLLDPIEINIPDIDIKNLDIKIPDFDLEPVNIQIPDIDIQIDPIVIDTDNFHRHYHWDKDGNKNDGLKDKDKEEKSEKNDKNKVKDKEKLKKIN